MYDNIIIAHDDSEYSLAAAREVAAWQQRHGGKALLLHSVYFDEEEYGILPDLLSKRGAQGKESCQRARDLMAKEFKVELETMVKEGDPPKAIVETARERGANLIAMGTYGRRGLIRLVMGSVTNQVIMDSPCDVLVVKKSRKECTGHYGSLLVPFDGSEPSLRALDAACRLAAEDKAEITVMYVIPRYEELLDFFKTEAIQASLRREAQKIVAIAEQRAAHLATTFATLITEGNAADEIVDVANQMKVELIVMGSSGWRGADRTIMGSTAERVIMGAHCPILVAVGEKP